MITVGNWDLQAMLHSQLQMAKLKLSTFLNNLFGCWTNIKIPFSEFTGAKAMGCLGC